MNIRYWILRGICTGAVLLNLGVHSQAATLFSENFSGSMDTAKWRVDVNGFESGLSTVTPLFTNGVLQIQGIGTTTVAAYWGGRALATVPTFSASLETNLVFTVDRVRVSGAGTAFRNGVWITDANRQNFVFVSENIGEGGWQYNYRLNIPGDRGTGAGVLLGAFNVDPINDRGLHQLKFVLNGQTVKVFADDTLGAEIPFPYPTGIVFELGAYTRDVNDSVDAAFDNVDISAIEPITFSTNAVTVTTNEAPLELAVRIPSGANATAPVRVTVFSQDRSIAVPFGSDEEGRLELLFPAGSPNVQPVNIQTVRPGVTTFSATSTLAVPIGEPLEVAVAAVADDFGGDAVNSSVWNVDSRGFEAGNGNYSATVSAGVVTLSGNSSTEYWGGIALMSQELFSASESNRLLFEVNRVSQLGTSTNRSGIWICDASRTIYILFSENTGEGGWQYNRKIDQAGDNPTGAGANIGIFDTMEDHGNHRLKLVANGSEVKFYIDNKLGATVPFPLSEGIQVGFGSYGRANADSFNTVFDRARIANFRELSDTTPFSIMITEPTSTSPANLIWEGYRGFTYQVHYSNDLVDWTPAENATFQPTLAVEELSWSDLTVLSPETGPQPQRFYKVSRSQ